ncbi:tRNA-dihydrouridine(16/17) synthase [NAD(P)(+)]-like protein [Geranomyces variabilis]|nr:tRNA-dihydrouridine(16/17) synthase [NAD(P)(+)]-like protein [Geranomyces variabilis]
MPSTLSAVDTNNSSTANPAAVPPPPNMARKLKGFDFYKTILKSPRFIVAPMVEQAWRILSNRYGADLCYTPMLHARLFSAPDAKYKNENWQTGPGDRPLIAQFCANEPDVLLAAAKMVENECDAVDINLGCPQHIAKRGKYGAFLQDEWDLIANMVKTLDQGLAIPVTCKIRVFPDVEKTIRYAKMIEAAGCQLLTVHGRLREQKGHKTGLADWEQIKRVKQSVGIPVFANGNILYKEDIDRCIEMTGVDGVMTAEGNLYNPGLFTGKHYASWKLAEEYIQICREIPESSTVSAMRGHFFKMFRPCLSEHTDLRTALAKANTVDGLADVVAQLKARLTVVSGGAEIYETPSTGFELDEAGYRRLPSWCLQPYFRVDGTLKQHKAPTTVEEMVEDAGGNVTTEKCTADEECLFENKDEEKAAVPPNQESPSKEANAEGAKGENKRPARDEVLKARKARAAARSSAVDSNNNRKKLVCASDTCGNIAAGTCAFALCKRCCRARPTVVPKDGEEAPAVWLIACASGQYAFSRSASIKDIRMGDLELQ